MIKVGDKVQIKQSAPKCSIHRGQIGVVEKVRYTRNISGTFFVRFSDGRCELYKEKDLLKIND